MAPFSFKRLYRVHCPFRRLHTARSGGCALSLQEAVHCPFRRMCTVPPGGCTLLLQEVEHCFLWLKEQCSTRLADTVLLQELWLRRGRTVTMLSRAGLNSIRRSHNTFCTLSYQFSQHCIAVNLTILSCFGPILRFGPPPFLSVFLPAYPPPPP
jgi:hypothetical protein